MGHSELSTMTPLSFTSPFTDMKMANSILVGPLGAWSRAAKALGWDSGYLCSHLYNFPDFDCLYSSVNIPWPQQGMGDAEYIHAFQRIVMPIGIEFAPELVISTFESRTLCDLPYLTSVQSAQALMLLRAMIWANASCHQMDMVT
jgi:hypothetical protein